MLVVTPLYSSQFRQVARCGLLEVSVCYRQTAAVDWKRLGSTVKARRGALGLSLADLGKLSGIDPKTIGSVEAGDRPRRAQTLGQIERALGWAEGSTRRILEGGAPIVADSEGEVVEVDGEWIELGRRLTPEERAEALEVLRRYVVPAIRAAREQDQR